MKTQIEVWLDDSNYDSSDDWAVSLCKDDGEELERISNHNTKQQAIKAAIKVAADRALKTYHRHRTGTLIEIG